MESVKAAIRSAVKRLSALIAERDLKAGSTLCGVLVDRAAREFFTFNVGDSKAFGVSPCESGGSPPALRVTALTTAHNLQNQAEKERIESHKGLFGHRVGGQLLVTRALGDLAFGECGLTDDPDITARPLTNEVMILLGSDGVWDFVDQAEVEECLTRHQLSDGTAIGRQLVGIALERSIDNISLIVLSLKLDK